ncbi:hypothetical protein [Rhizobacter sp. LjRoot28]|uniref:hypothetical protein n=1 Tax=Rhizobacter sp. LjRoot28 TaxID=3342309 RepID=UPI003ED06DF9
MTDRFPLPASWTWCQLGDVVDYGSTDKAEPSELGSGDWILELEDIEKDTSRLLQRATFQMRQSKSTKNRFQAGDVLYGKLRPYLNKVVHADAGGFCTTEIVPLRPPPEVNSRYLFHWLRHPEFTGYVNEVSHGLSMPRLGTESGKQAPFVLAPIAEQKRIADKLDALLVGAGTCRDRLGCVPIILKRFRQAVLDSAMNGALTADWRAVQDFAETGTELTAMLSRRHELSGGHKAGNAASPTEDVHDLAVESLPTGWGLTTLRDAVEPDRPITYGILMPGPDLSDGVPYVRVADFPNDRLDLSGIRRTSASMDAEFKRSRLRTNDLLLSIRGTVGRLVKIPPELDAANITQDSARLSIQPAMNGSFVLWYLRSDLAQSRMRRAIKGVAVRGINIGDVRAFQLPVPSRAEQDEIVRRIESLFALADVLDSRLATARAQVDRLTSALLVKAFRGELVPQDPNDEPAEKLLERIALARRTAALARKRAPSSRSTNLKPAPKQRLSTIILQMPKSDFTFDDLRQVVTGDYESLKDELFAMLADKGSGIEQFFDADAKLMKLRRVSK